MDSGLLDLRGEPLATIAPALDRLLADPGRLDGEARFPGELVSELGMSGLLAAPLPVRLGGLGLGTQPEAATRCVALLRAMGRAWMPLGRVFEGHLNALRLVMLYGSAAQASSAAADAHAGHLFAVWIAENPADPLRVEDGALQGRKTFASGAGAVTRALVTAQADGEQLVLVAVPPGDGRIIGKPDLHGMRGAGTARLDLSGLPAPDSAKIGAPGDYMRQPEISLGAWRTLAVLSGGLAALAAVTRAELSARGRARQPHQSARLGALVVADETARLWAERAGQLAETRGDEDAANYVKLARYAVDRACLRGIEHAQRAAGLAAFARPHPIERLCRDLATYMRQPALDEVLDEAAQHFLDLPLP